MKINVVVFRRCIDFHKGDEDRFHDSKEYFYQTAKFVFYWRLFTGNLNVFTGKFITVALMIPPRVCPKQIIHAFIHEQAENLTIWCVLDLASQSL